MYRRWHYIIRPLDKLVDLLDQYAAKHDNQLEQWLRKPSIWSKNPGRAFVGWEDEHEAQIKVMFVANLISAHQDNTNAEYRALLEEILGAPPYSLDTFNRWWGIEYVRDDIHSFTDYEQKNWISPDIFAMFGASGMSYIDHWLDQHEKEKSQP